VGAGTLLKLNFTTIGPIGSASAVGFTGFMFNEGIPCVGTSNGSVTIVSGTISGIVNYSNSAAFKPVPNTTLSAAGSVNTAANSAFASGAYALSGMGSGAYTVTPSKTSDVSAISGFDSALIAQHVVALITLTPAQAAAADVSENAVITSFDAALIARFVVSLPDAGITGTWKFNPANRSYANVEANQPGQDFGAILMGEVSGDWTAPTMFAASEKNQAAPEATVSVSIPNKNVQQNENFEVLVTVGDTTGQGIISYQFDLLYDPAILQPQAMPIDASGTMSSGMSITPNNPSPGLLKVVAFQATPISGSGTLLKFKFNAIGSPLSNSALTWQNFMFNEGNPGDNAIDGRIFVVFSPTAASVDVSGRVLSAVGQPVKNAEVVLTGGDGAGYVARSNQLGYYLFEGIPAGESYVISVRSKRHTFNPRLLAISDSISDLDLVAIE
jgi:hypothetical protein